MLESIGGWGSTYKRVLEVADVGINRGSTYKHVLEVADVGIDMEGGQKKYAKFVKNPLTPSADK